MSPLKSFTLIFIASMVVVFRWWLVIWIGAPGVSGSMTYELLRIAFGLGAPSKEFESMLIFLKSKLGFSSLVMLTVGLSLLSNSPGNWSARLSKLTGGSSPPAGVVVKNSLDPSISLKSIDDKFYEIYIYYTAIISKVAEPCENTTFSGDIFWSNVVNYSYFSLTPT